MLKKINEATSSMMEYGFHQFYTSIATFKQKLVDRVFLDQDDDDLYALTMAQLSRPLVFLLLLCGLASIVFVAEIINFKWRNLRNQRAITPRDMIQETSPPENND